MKKSADPPKTVLETILDWSKTRPEWQPDVLRRIVLNRLSVAEQHRGGGP